MVSTRTTAQSQREVQRLDCSVPGLWLSWLLVVHIVRPLGVALVLYWKQRAWRGQGAAVAGAARADSPGPCADPPDADLPGRFTYSPARFERNDPIEPQRPPLLLGDAVRARVHLMVARVAAEVPKPLELVRHPRFRVGKPRLDARVRVPAPEPTHVRAWVHGCGGC